MCCVSPGCFGEQYNVIHVHDVRDGWTRDASFDASDIFQFELIV